MTDGPCDIALDHLERLKKTLREELDNLETSASELAAEQVIKKSRIEELASTLHGLKDLDFSSGTEDQAGDDSGSGGQNGQSQLKLKELIEKITVDLTGPGPSHLYTNMFVSFRSRLIMVINTLDLIAVALRRNAELLKRKDEESTPKIYAECAVGSRAAPGSSAIIRSQESERHRIAREIHDGPAQAIATVVFRMDILSKVYEKDPSKVPGELAKMKEIAQGALDEIRGFIFDLRPMTLADLGLVATIKRVVTTIQEMSDLDVRMVVDGKERDLGQFVTLTVFRIAQESLNNLKKYSNCNVAWVHLKYMPDKFILVVEDDGCGFNLDEVERSRNNYTSFGLLGMRERADDINAEFTITSKPGYGTKVTLVVPTVDNPALRVKWED